LTGVESGSSLREWKACTEETWYHVEDVAGPHRCVTAFRGSREHECETSNADRRPLNPAGFGYSFFDQRLVDWAGAQGLDEFSGSFHDYLSQPLVNQPGERWEYGINIDWAGQLVERASGLKLNDYFQEHIFKPLGLKNINMFPHDEMKRNLAFMNDRAPDGSLSLRLDGHLNRRPLYAKGKEEIDGVFQQGGAGCFARPTEYVQIIAALLNDGVHAGTENRILKKETVDLMFSNQVRRYTGERGASARPQ